GIRDFHVTGVQTCALPIFFAGEAYEFKVVKQEETWLSEIRFSPNPEHKLLKDGVETHLSDMGMGSLQAMTLILKIASLIRLNKRSEERRVGKEWRSRSSPE